MRFSECFAIARADHDDWFDSIIDNDTRLFIDPFLIFADSAPTWKEAHDEIISYFNLCFSLIAEGGCRSGTPAYDKALGLLRFPEPREFCLGYTSTGTRGAGGGRLYASAIAEAMSAAISRGVQSLSHFEELGVLNEGIGPDRISDLTCNVLRARFISYTKDVANRHHLPLSTVSVGAASFDRIRKGWRKQSHDLPINPYTRRHILLTPSRFLCDLPILNADDWWENYEAERLRNDMNYEVMGRVDKGTIVAVARENIGSVEGWAKEKEATVAAPYDLNRDRQGLYQWDRASREFVADHPLAVPPATNVTSFRAALGDIIGQFRHFIEEQGGWRLLWDDDLVREKREDSLQLLFFGVARAYCAANNIVVDREPNLGRGPVDFKFSNGFARRALMETKKLHNSRYWRGLEQQLPSYLESDQVDDGWFVTVRYFDGEPDTDPTERVSHVVARVREQTGKNIVSVFVDARPKTSASNL
jgi:hypothetical protein